MRKWDIIILVGSLALVAGSVLIAQQIRQGQEEQDEFRELVQKDPLEFRREFIRMEDVDEIRVVEALINIMESGSRRPPPQILTNFKTILDLAREDVGEARFRSFLDEVEEMIEEIQVPIYLHDGLDRKKIGKSHEALLGIIKDYREGRQ